MLEIWDSETLLTNACDEVAAVAMALVMADNTGDTLYIFDGDTMRHVIRAFDACP